LAWIQFLEAPTKRFFFLLTTMTEKTMTNTEVEEIICAHAHDNNAVFVFPTGISAQLWLERYLEIIGSGSCAAEQFIAWDTFKSSAVRSKMQDKKSIPSTLRKLFIAALVAENSELIHANKPPLFTSLILPQYESSAPSFVKWLTTILPGLAAWEEKFLQQNYESDDEDRDLLMLNNRYKEFLDQRQLFEPAWEKPPFESNGHHYYIFFPEIITDFHEYEKLLALSCDITIVAVPGENVPYDAMVTDEARTEIKKASLFIRALTETEKIPWDDIAVSIPDIESYKPYLLREFSLRNIPYTVRAGKKLFEYQAGKLFSQIEICVSQFFSFSALSTLLLNTSIPWKNQKAISQLIDFGIRNNCVSSWNEDGVQIDIWEATFHSIVGQGEEICALFYRELKKSLTALCAAKSFAEIRAKYFQFKNVFLGDEFLLESDLVLSRCIRELVVLVELEETFPDVMPSNPFSFFVERLTEIDYLPQQHSRGVNIFPYKVAASAPFAAQIVIGAHQDALSAVFQQMQFLAKSKRDVLGVTERDATEYFIKLYMLNSFAHCASFFCSKHTFAGYLMPHTLFDESKNSPALFEEDYFTHEQALLLNVQEESCEEQDENQIFYASQAKSFGAWFKTYSNSSGNEEIEEAAVLNQAVKQKIAKKYSESEHGDKYRVSATTLKEYFDCGVYWIYNSLFGIRPIPTDVSTMPPTVMGNIYHAVLKEFFDGLISNNELVLQELDPQTVLSEAYSKKLTRSVDAVFSRFPMLAGSTPLSPFAVTILDAQKQGVEQSLEYFLGAFLDLFAGYTIQASEKELIYGGLSDAVITGRLDCVLLTGENRTAIIDFKKYTLPTRASCISQDLKDFQLPLYTLLSEANNYSEVSTALFMSILKKEKQVILGSVSSVSTNKTYPAKNSIIERSGANGKELIDLTLAFVNRFVNEIQEGSCTTISSDFAKCFACNFRKLCRKTYNIAGKRNI
jgi:hypothetical protein